MLFKNRFFFKIWRVVKLLIQNLTRCKNFNSKSAFQIIFSDSGWIIINVLPTCGKILCSFYVTRTRKDNKKRQNTFFLCQKKMNSVPNKQLLLNVPFQSTKYRKKELCMDNKVRETIGDVFCPTCRNEKCVYISTYKTTGFYDCRKCKACCIVLNIPFKNQKPTGMLFGGDGTHCFASKTSRDYEKGKPSPFLKKFIRQSQPSTSELEP